MFILQERYQVGGACAGLSLLPNAASSRLLERESGMHYRWLSDVAGTAHGGCGEQLPRGE